jgi:hypothetical protein
VFCGIYISKETEESRSSWHVEVLSVRGDTKSPLPWFGLHPWHTWIELSHCIPYLRTNSMCPKNVEVGRFDATGICPRVSILPLQTGLPISLLPFLGLASKPRFSFAKGNNIFKFLFFQTIHHRRRTGKCGNTTVSRCHRLLCWKICW